MKVWDARRVRIAPADPAVQFQLGLAYTDAGNLDAALDAFRRTVQLRPDDADGHYNLGVIVGEKIRGLVDEKVIAYRKAAELRPAQADAHYHLGVAYIQQAQLSRVEGKRALLQLALEQFRLRHGGEVFLPIVPRFAPVEIHWRRGA